MLALISEKERDAIAIIFVLETVEMRYFLNVRTIDALLVDDEGNEFTDLGEVCRHALEVASELAREYPRLPADRATVVPLALEVMDESGNLVFRTPVH